MSEQLNPGEMLTLESTGQKNCRVDRLLWIEGWGEIYRVYLDDKPFALKWYYPGNATPEQQEAIRLLIQNGAPSDRFLWPLDMVAGGDGNTFGYLMPLQGAEYVEIFDLMRREPDASFRTLCTAGFQLVQSFLHLHAKGLCFRSLDFSNLLVNPNSGDVLLQRIDDVHRDEFSIRMFLGTQGFMAPEVVRGEVYLGIEADRYSLAVLLFYIFMMAHPLDGEREASIHAFDIEVQRQLYGTNPVFIFDPDNSSNRPVPGIHDNAIAFWAIYPKFFQDLFTTAFTDGLSMDGDYSKRIKERQWMTAMIKLRNSIVYCTSCRAENFYDVEAIPANGGHPGCCWNCKQEMRLPPQLRIGGQIIMLNDDTRLTAHHVDANREWDFNTSVAEVTPHPTKPGVWYLKNTSDRSWDVTLADNSWDVVASGQTVPIANVVKIHFGATAEGEIRASKSGQEQSSSEMSERLQKGQMLTLESTGQKSCRVDRLLGAGGQGEVYLVYLDNQPYALKWYFPDSATLEQQKALRMLIRKRAPSDRFLWPLDMVYGGDGNTFGYLMPLRGPEHVSMVDLLQRKAEATFRALCTAGFQLAQSFHHLHAKGLCYESLTFANIFLDPITGDVLMCEFDYIRVDGASIPTVLGTPGFMAPEIVRGEAYPSIETDQYSLAVLLFYIFMMAHPLDGEREASNHAFDLASRIELYGKNPIFIYDPNDSSNRPVPGIHDNAIVFWKIYPKFFRDLFTVAFTDGLGKDGDYSKRVKEIQWRAAMIKLRDSIVYCTSCRAENFYDVEAIPANGGHPGCCWNCKQELRLPPQLRIGGQIVMLNDDTQLYPHHLDSYGEWDFDAPSAEMTQHPTDSGIWALKNISDRTWVATYANGERQEVRIGQVVPFFEGVQIRFIGGARGEIHFAPTGLPAATVKR